jgi:hypothetical protein
VVITEREFDSLQTKGFSRSISNMAALPTSTVVEETRTNIGPSTAGAW